MSYVEETEDESGKSPSIPQVGHLLAQYDTGNRITCLKAFVMNERSDDDATAGAGEGESDADEFNGFSTAAEEEGESSDSDESE